MKTPLSRDEMQTLDRQMATLAYQTNEIARLLEVRLGSANDMAGSARMMCDQVTKFAKRVHLQNESLEPEQQSKGLQSAASTIGDSITAKS